MDEPEYDEKTCITAGELRHIGIDIAKDIPDVAWIPRSSMIITDHEISYDKPDDDPDGTVTGVLHFQITEPFRWYRATMTVTVPPDDTIGE